MNKKQYLANRTHTPCTKEIFNALCIEDWPQMSTHILRSLEEQGAPMEKVIVDESGIHLNNQTWFKPRQKRVEHGTFIDATTTRICFVGDGSDSHVHLDKSMIKLVSQDVIEAHFDDGKIIRYTFDNSCA